MLKGGKSQLAGRQQCGFLVVHVLHSPCPCFGAVLGKADLFTADSHSVFVNGGQAFKASYPARCQVYPDPFVVEALAALIAPIADPRVCL